MRKELIKKRNQKHAKRLWGKALRIERSYLLGRYGIENFNPYFEYDEAGLIFNPPCMELWYEHYMIKAREMFDALDDKAIKLNGGLPF